MRSYGNTGAVACAILAFGLLLRPDIVTAQPAPPAATPISDVWPFLKKPPEIAADASGLRPFSPELVTRRDEFVRQWAAFDSACRQQQGSRDAWEKLLLRLRKHEAVGDDDWRAAIQTLTGAANLLAAASRLTALPDYEVQCLFIPVEIAGNTSLQMLKDTSNLLALRCFTCARLSRTTESLEAGLAGLSLSRRRLATTSQAFRTGSATMLSGCSALNGASQAMDPGTMRQLLAEAERMEPQLRFVQCANPPAMHVYAELRSYCLDGFELPFDASKPAEVMMDANAAAAVVYPAWKLPRLPAWDPRRGTVATVAREKSSIPGDKPLPTVAKIPAVLTLTDTQRRAAYRPPDFADTWSRQRAAAAWFDLMCLNTAAGLMEKETGRKPARVADLAPKYLKVEPRDPYRRRRISSQPHDGFLLFCRT